MIFQPFGPIKSLFVALQGDDDPSAVAAGFALGAALGLVPSGNLIAGTVLFMLFFFRVDKAMAALSVLLFTPLGYLLDRPAHWLGYGVLTVGALKPLWTALYNLPIVPWTRFNNTIVMGNLLIGLALYYPLYRLAMRGIFAYRTRWKAKVDQWPIIKTINGWGWVQTLHRWHEKWTAIKPAW